MNRGFKECLIVLSLAAACARGDSCSWLTPTNQNSTLQCVDGTFCNWETNLDGNRCCNSHQGRSKCPKNYPMMCASRVCAGVRDYCCSSNSCKASGRRLCGKRTSVRPAEIHDGLKSIYKSLLNSKSTSRVLWIEEVPDKSCTANRIRHRSIQTSDSATDQRACQTLCEAEASCIGITWSTKGHFCYVCKNDILSDAKSNYGFYRRP